MTRLSDQRASWRSSTGASTIASEKSYALKENGKWQKTEGIPYDEAEEGIEEAFQPPHDEERQQQMKDKKTNNEDDEKKDLVDWDGPHDPENPQNFSRSRKWLITIATGLMTFVVSFGSSVFSTVTEVTSQEFGVTSEVMILGVSLYVLGFACGPLIWGPMSEGYGRRLPYMVGFFGFIIFQIPIAVASNVRTILVCRFLAGSFGSSTLAITAGMYVDFWDTVTRGQATMLFAAAVFAGPAMGPVIGEFTTKNESLGWRWTAWFCMIMAAVFFVPSLFIVPETLAPVLLQRRAAKRRLETRNWALHSKLDEDPVTFHALVVKYLFKPLKMLIQEPILIVITAYMSLVYGILYLTFVGYPISFEMDRGIAFGEASLPFLAVFIGVLLGCLCMTWETTVIFQPKLKKAGKLIPEERLIPMMVGGFVIVIGLFWFAWTSFPSISPWPQIISGIFIGAGFVSVFMSGVVYIVDVYLFDANSAHAANSFVRSIFAAAFPLFATYMFEGLGVQWAMSLLGFLCVALLPAPFVFYFYGKKIRSWSKFAYNLG